MKDNIVYEDTNHSKIQLKHYFDSDGDERIEITMDKNPFTGKYYYGLTKTKARKLAKEIMILFKIEKEFVIKDKYKRRWMK